MKKIVLLIAIFAWIVISACTPCYLLYAAHNCDDASLSKSLSLFGVASLYLVALSIPTIKKMINEFKA